MKRLPAAIVAFVLCVSAASAAGFRAVGAFDDSPAPLEAKAKAKSKPAVEVNLPRASASTGGNFGLGVLLGEPTGLSAKYWFDAASAADAGAAWSFVDSSFAFHADYLFHLRKAFIVAERDIPPFAGIGGYLRARTAAPNGLEFGIRIPLGICHRLLEFPLELSLELVPGIELFPATTPRFQGGLAVRYYF